jgi:hypothetical protein
MAKEITTSGSWTDVQPTPSGFRGKGGNQIRWGGGGESGYGFAGGTVPVKLDSSEFILGTFTHTNRPTNTSPNKFTATLKVTIKFDEGNLTREFIFPFEHYETPNNTRDPKLDADEVNLPTVQSSETVTLDNREYRVVISGFKQGGLIVRKFLSDEDSDNSADIVAKFSPATRDNLKVCQQAAVSVEAGEEGHIGISVENPDHNTVDLKKAELVFDAPSGFEWTGHITFTYYGLDGKSIGSGETTLTPTLDNGNRRLRLKGLQELKPSSMLVYGLRIKAKPDTKPGRYTDGQALVADSVPLRLTATVTREEMFITDELYQPTMLEAKQGDKLKAMNVTVLKQGKEQDLNSLQHQFRAPTGFRWTGKVTYAFYDANLRSQGSKEIKQPQVTDDGRTLTFTGMPKAPEGCYLTYSLLLDVAEDAAVGRHDDGEAKIGNFRPLTLHATVLEKNEPSNCNRS